MFTAISALIAVFAVMYRGLSEPKESTAKILAFGLLFFLFWVPMLFVKWMEICTGTDA